MNMYDILNQGYHTSDKSLYEAIDNVPVVNHTERADMVEFDLDIVRSLIINRMKHCKEQLLTMQEAGQAVREEYSLDIAYKDGGHFSIPVYVHMEEWLNKVAGKTLVSKDVDIAIVQQALRELYYEINVCDIDPNTKYAQDSFRILTDLMVSFQFYD
jgi:hypothetical protein